MLDVEINGPAKNKLGVTELATILCALSEQSPERFEDVGFESLVAHAIQLCACLTECLDDWVAMIFRPGHPGALQRDPDLDFCPAFSGATEERWSLVEHGQRHCLLAALPKPDRALDLTERGVQGLSGDVQAVDRRGERRVLGAELLAPVVVDGELDPDVGQWTGELERREAVHGAQEAGVAFGFLALVKVQIRLNDLGEGQTRDVALTEVEPPGLFDARLCVFDVTELEKQLGAGHQDIATGEPLLGLGVDAQRGLELVERDGGSVDLAGDRRQPHAGLDLSRGIALSVEAVDAGGQVEVETPEEGGIKGW